jgi:protein-S-isoprenylcysteine O-methyltransferase Ste14
MGLAVFGLGNAFGCWALVSNRFFSTYLRIQADRGHRVVADGPYGIVRHPGYGGTILASLALPISLGSLWALIPAALGACGFVVRTTREDAILLRALDGYRDYARHVRYRLVPGVW